MGSNKAIDFFDNDSELDYSEAIEFLKNYFIEEFPNFKAEGEYYDPKGYWGIFFLSNGSEIFLGSERSFLAYKLVINGEEIYLPKIDKRLFELKATSKKNFHFLLDFIKKYLQNKHLL